MSGDEFIHEGIYNTKSEAYQVTVRLLDEFYALAQKNSSVPILLLFPQKEDFKTFIRLGQISYSPLLEHIQGKGYSYIDLFDAFRAYAKGQEYKKLFPLHSSHYTTEGNRLVAEHIFAYLKKNHLLEKDSVEQLKKHP